MTGKPSGPRVVCVGFNVESEVAIRGLLEAGAKIVGLVTTPPRPTSQGSDYVDLHPLCGEWSIPVVDAVDINDPVVVDRIFQLEPDYIFALGWSQLFREPLLAAPENFVVGSHPSPLPSGRGRAPVPWTILEEADRTAVSLFRMDQGADSGPILKQRWFDVPAGIYAVELYRLVAENLREAFVELYGELASGAVEARLQDERAASYRAKRTPADGHLDFNRPALELARLVRAVSSPYPGAYTYLGDARLIFERASLDNVPAYRGTPGQVLLRRDGRVLVQAGDRPFWLWEMRSDADIGEDAELRVGVRLGYRLEDEIHSLRAEVAALRQALASDR